VKLQRLSRPPRCAVITLLLLLVLRCTSFDHLTTCHYHGFTTKCSNYCSVPDYIHLRRFIWSNTSSEVHPLDSKIYRIYIKLTRVHRNTPIGFLHRLVWVSTPRALRYVDDRITGGAISPATARLGHHLMYEKHNIVLVCDLLFDDYIGLINIYRYSSLLC